MNQSIELPSRIFHIPGTGGEVHPSVGELINIPNSKPWKGIAAGHCYVKRYEPRRAFTSNTHGWVLEVEVAILHETAETLNLPEALDYNLYDFGKEVTE